MSLRIRRLKLLVVTEGANYGADISFSNGLVLLRAENSTGKSTCLKSIVYALGLERMFGPGNHPPLTPAMTSVIKDGKEEFAVLESQVFLEIANATGDFLTIQRQVVGPSERDWRLVDVWEGAVLDQPSPGGSKPYYVRDPGTATRTSGFHTKLADFIGWQLPEVLKYDGSLVPLYMECLLPLFYVEQRNGWSSIQATTPRYLQIRDVEKKALEYLLNLDAFTRDVQRQQLLQEESELKKDWHLQRQEIELVANSCGGTVRNLPSAPAPKWPPEVAPFIEIYRDEQPISLNAALDENIAELKRLQEEEIPSVQQTVSLATAELSAAYERLDELEVLAKEIADDISLENTEQAALSARVAALNDDLKKNQDVVRLRNYGAIEHLHVTSGECPTCRQSIADVLLDQRQQETVMTIDENIEYIKNQIQTFERLQARMTGGIKAKQRKLDAVENKIGDIRGEIRTLKRTLIADGRIPSLAALRERLVLEEESQRFVVADEKFTGQLGAFEVLSAKWRSLLARKRRLTADVFSQDDRNKLDRLENRFRELEEIFGFDSFPTATLSLSRDNYRPTREGFDLVYAVSASDNIRTSCAFLLGLLEMSRVYDTNHPGVLILDEPRQQNVEWSDHTEVFVRAAQAKEYGQQVIVATSDSDSRVEEVCEKTDCELISFPDHILSRLSS
jgi:hypothetical protein